jgi:hypothetical protein
MSHLKRQQELSLPITVQFVNLFALQCTLRYLYKTGMLMDYIHRPVSTFRRLALSPSSGGCSGVKSIHLGPVEQAISIIGSARSTGPN